jgi:hypothetical protein
MNIIKLQNMLRSVPDESLIGYVQNPQGEVPSYLALSELQRRKDTREKYQAQQAPESSVAEDITQEAQPSGLAMLAKNPDLSPGAPMSQGVADLPVDDSMYQEDSFASGGIVAFQKGGYSYSPDYDPVEQYRRARQLGESNLMARRYNMPTTSVTSAGIETPYDASLSYYQDLRDKAAMSGKGLTDLTSTVNTLQDRRKAWLSGSLDPYTQTSPVGSKPNMEGLQKPVITQPAVTNKPDVTLTGDPITGNQPGQRGSSSGFNPSAYDKMINKEKTLQELSDEYKALLGTDPTLAGRQERLAKMDARAKRMEDMAPGMAMLEAGLGIAAGTSPFALTNIGQGAMAGVRSYGDAQNRLAQLEERRLALDSELARQQRAEQMAALTFGERSRQHTAEMNRTVMLAKEKDRLTRDMTLAEIAGRTDAAIIRSRVGEAPKVKDVAEARAAYQTSPQRKADIERIIKENKLGDNAVKPSSPKYPEFIKKLKIAEEQYLANYFSPIGSNIPGASTQGFEITNP